MEDKDSFFNDYKVCTGCSIKFWNMGIAGKKICFCGSELRDLNEEEKTQVISGIFNTEYPTISC